MWFFILLMLVFLLWPLRNLLFCSFRKCYPLYLLRWLQYTDSSCWSFPGIGSGFWLSLSWYFLIILPILFLNRLERHSLTEKVDQSLLVFLLFSFHFVSPITASDYFEFHVSGYVVFADTVLVSYIHLHKRDHGNHSI